MYPSFLSIHGREPQPGVDFDPNGFFCEDDYNYLNGYRDYHHFRLGIVVDLDKFFSSIPQITYSIEVESNIEIGRWMTVRICHSLLNVEKYLKPRGMTINKIPLSVRKYIHEIGE